MTAPVAFVGLQGKTHKTCSRCKGDPKPISEFYVIKDRKRTTNSSYCKSCTRAVNQERKPEDPTATKGRATRWREENWVWAMFRRARSRAKQKGQICTVTPETIQQLWDRQAGLCALTGEPMTLVFGQGRIHTNASVDRIDSNYGYIEGNIWLVCAIINRTKQELNVGDFQSWCAKVVAHANRTGSAVQDTPTPENAAHALVGRNDCR